MASRSAIPRDKRPYKYKDILAQRLLRRPVITPPRADPERPIDGWIASGRSAESWRRAILDARASDQIARQEMAREFLEKVIALADDLGIDRTSEGWGRDFAHEIVGRHEPEYLRASGPPYSTLFAKYDIDPDQPEADFGLGLAIAAKYVDGMKFQDPTPIKGRHTKVDLAIFVVAVGAVRRHLGCGDYGCSDRQIAEILCNYRQLSKIIPAPAAKRVIAMNGNSNSPLSNSAIRGYLRQIRTAWPDFLADRATAFQKQFVEEVYPFLLRLERIFEEEHRVAIDIVGQSQADN